MSDSAKTVVDRFIASMGPRDERVLLLDPGLWNAFIWEAGLQPAPSETSTLSVRYAGFEIAPKTPDREDADPFAAD